MVWRWNYNVGFRYKLSVNGCDAGRERFTTCRTWWWEGSWWEMEVPHGRPALFGNQANLCVLSCCILGSIQGVTWRKEGHSGSNVDASRMAGETTFRQQKETFACVYPGRSWDAGWCACDFVHATVWRKNDLWRSMWWLVRNDTALSLEPSKSSWQNSTKKRERVCKKTGKIESCTDKSHGDQPWCVVCEGCLGLKGSECEAHLVDWPVGRKKHWDKLCVVGSLAARCTSVEHHAKAWSWVFSGRMTVQIEREREGSHSLSVPSSVTYTYTCKMSLTTDGGLEQIRPSNAKHTSTVLFFKVVSAAHTITTAPVSVMEWIWMADCWRMWVTTLVLPW